MMIPQNVHNNLRQALRPTPMAPMTPAVGPTAAPNTGMAPHQMAQVGAPGGVPTSAPHMGVNTGEIGVPWAQRFAR